MHVTLLEYGELRLEKYKIIITNDASLPGIFI